MSMFHKTGYVCFIALVAAGLSGCVEDRTSLTIMRNAVPNADCTVDSSSGEFRAMGWLDLSEEAFSDALNAPPQYFMYPVVQNNLIATADQGTGAELNVVEIKEARIDLALGDIAGDFETLRFKVSVFITLFPGESAALSVPVINSDIAALLATAVQGNPTYQPIVRVKLKFLYQLGIREKESHQIEYPVVLCDGCLINVGGYCDSGLFTTLANPGNTCNLSQDAPVDCCLDNGGGVVCPAVDTSTQE